MKRPDFFIVGAFKAGTTAMYEYLRRHPQVFMPELKEPMYFGADLTPRYERMTEAQYLELFRGARPDQRAGEASPWYLYSSAAPAEIRAFNPDARIVIMLRNPVDVMHAQHSQMVFNAREDIADFAAALAAEDNRRHGRRVPATAIRPEALFYRHSVRFAEQVRRWLDVFGRERVHFIVFDDLVADPRAVWRGLLEFLDVDPAVEVDLAAYNPSRRARSGRLQRVLYNPPGPLRGLMGRLRRVALLHRLRDRAVSANSRRAARDDMHPELRRQLTREMAPQVAELGELIGRDLSAWSRP